MPARLAKMFPSVVDTCWRCDAVGAGFSHIWWFCPIIKQFWSNIRLSIQEILAVKVPLNMRGFLRYDLQNWKQGRRYSTMIAHLPSAASLLIARE